MSNYLQDKKKSGPQTWAAMKQRGEKIVMLTAYDYTMARIIDTTPVDMILVGDSAANVMQGYDSTVPMSMEEMIVYARSVVRGAPHTFVVCDMPFGSYQVSVEEAVRNAIRLVQTTGCDAVKLEGGEEIIDAVRAIIRAGVPVVGHLGLTPQYINIFGNYGVRAKEEAEAEKLKADATLLAEAGCIGIVLEKIPAMLAMEVTAGVKVPTIGIGAGSATDGQVLVLQDMLGMNQGFAPKFLRKYANLFDDVAMAVSHYAADVKSLNFPSATEQY